MELHQLRYFCAVAHNGNFTRAAKAENVAQPSLSQQILKLEAELSAKLFDRFPRSARLTQFGRTFLFRAEAILRQVGEARTEIQEMAGADAPMLSGLRVETKTTRRRSSSAGVSKGAYSKAGARRPARGYLVRWVDFQQSDFAFAQSYVILASTISANETSTHLLEPGRHRI
jgi:hypothetical protein